MRWVVPILLMLITSTAASSLSSAGASDLPPQISREQIERQIANALPLGSTREQVLAFLDAHHVENSSSSGAASPNQVLAIYRDVSGSSLVVKKAVQVIFRFKGNALESYSVVERFAGP